MYDSRWIVQEVSCLLCEIEHDVGNHHIIMIKISGGATHMAHALSRVARPSTWFLELSLNVSPSYRRLKEVCVWLRETSACQVHIKSTI